MELVFKWLDEEDNYWLMILDTADSADLLFTSAESDILYTLHIIDYS